MTGAGLQVLVVDDDPTVSDVVRRYLHQAGFRVRLRRQLPTLPIIVLTALGGEANRLEGVAAGADDYLAKPFSPRELTLRVQSMLRRATPPTEVAAAVLGDGELSVDSARRVASIDGSPISLTGREFDLLAFLMRHPGQAWSRKQLMEKVWGWRHGEESTVTVHVRRVREKVERDPAEPRRIAHALVTGAGLAGSR